MDLQKMRKHARSLDFNSKIALIEIVGLGENGLRVTYGNHLYRSSVIEPKCGLSFDIKELRRLNLMEWKSCPTDADDALLVATEKGVVAAEFLKGEFIALFGKVGMELKEVTA